MNGTAPRTCTCDAMPVIEIRTEVRAPLDRCFDLSRDIDLHLVSMRATGERAVAGRTSGLIGLGEEVTWEARHLGVRQRFTSRITEFARPHYFQDRMVRGAFRSFARDHFSNRGSRDAHADCSTSVRHWARSAGSWMPCFSRAICARCCSSASRSSRRPPKVPSPQARPQRDEPGSSMSV